ncbi:MAG: DNA replication terminus site-binding protein [Salinisphaeraceae bacterium]
MDLSAAKAAIATAASDLDDAVASLNGVLAAAEDRRAITYELPMTRTPVAGDNGGEGHEVEPITVDRREGADARLAARRIIAALDYHPDQDASSPQRLVGVVGVPAAAIEAVANVNAAKARLRDAVAVIGQKRWSRERKHLARARTLCLLQCYRTLRIFPDGLDRVSFGWDAHGAAGIRLTVAEARARVSGPGHYGLAPERQVEAELATLAELPATEVLLMRKPLQPSPAANLWRPGQRRAEHCRTGLPFLVVTPPDGPLPLIRDLPDFDPEQARRSTRRDRYTEDEPLVDRLYLYRYRPAHRSHAEVPPAAAALHVDGDDVILRFDDRTQVLDLYGGLAEFAAFTDQALAGGKPRLVARGAGLAVTGHTRVHVLARLEAEGESQPIKLSRAKLRRRLLTPA